LTRKRVRVLLSILIISQLLLAACIPLKPDTSLSTETATIKPSATMKPTQEPTESPAPTATSVPSIAITDKLLKGLNITVRHPFYDAIDDFDQMIRDFNLNNLWGIHVTGIASGGTDGLKNDLNDGLVEDDLVIGMGYDLLAVQSDTQFIALDDYARDKKFGVEDLFESSPFTEFTPRFGESVNYTIPLAYNAGILLYNTTWAEELGFTSPPDSQESLLGIAKAAKEVNQTDNNYGNNGTGGLWLSQSPLSAQSWYRAFGGEFAAQDGGFEPQSQPLLDSFTFLKESYDANQAWIGVESLPYRYFSDRNAIVAEGTLESLKYQAAYQGAGAFQDNWTTLAYPGADGNNSLVLEPLSFAIQSSDSESELAAWIFANWLMEPAQQARLVEMHGLWPSTGDPNDITPDYASSHPYWAAALQADPTITLVPNTGEWASVRLVFQDAYKRIYDLDSEYFPNIVEVFGQTTRTNEEQRP